MSQNPTQFNILPNEVMYNIFEFLTSLDILRAFARLNHRYDDLVRFYVKKIDLTDGWKEDRQLLRWVCNMIQILKIDRFYIHIFDDQWWSNVENITSTRSRKIFHFFDADEKFSLRSIIRKIFSSSQKTTISSKHLSLRSSSITDYRFPQLHSLHLVNVFDWNKIIFGRNLKTLNLWFDEDIHYDDEDGQIPETVTQFSTNTILNANAFHINLINLNIYIRSIVHLIEIIEHTPNVEQLSVTFTENFDTRYRLEKYPSNRVELMTTNLCCLHKLINLSLKTKLLSCAWSNEHLPFDQIQFFIDRYCPNMTILKKVNLKFDYIIFDENIWSIIVRYKNTFDQFNFYASFIMKEDSNIIQFLSIDDHFGFHTENSITTEDRYIHVYSLPFGFDHLHGFISCSELNHQLSFSAVHHLHFTQTCLDRPVSFESLTKYMPHLTSIYCNFLYIHDFDDAVPQIIVDQDIFNHVRSLSFLTFCWSDGCACHNLLPRLFDRMPNLQFCISSQDTFIHAQRPLPPIKRLDLRECDFKSFDILVELLPHLTILLLDRMILNSKELSNLLSSLFIGISSLTFISFRISTIRGRHRESDKRIASKALIHVRMLDDRLRHLKLDFGSKEIAFYIQNI